MGKIRCLDPHVADLIAAGEVVERPGAVVKELMENAIDAGATAVTVEIARGGMQMIRVTDNGSGIAQEDVKTAFLRHATSKIRTEYDLEAIETLGFRGEALAAVHSRNQADALIITQRIRCNIIHFAYFVYFHPACLLPRLFPAFCLYFPF